MKKLTLKGFYNNNQDIIKLYDWIAYEYQLIFKKALSIPPIYGEGSNPKNKKQAQYTLSFYQKEPDIVEYNWIKENFKDYFHEPIIITLEDQNKKTSE